MAARAGVSDTAVLRVWRAHGLKPHLVRSFKVSRDPRFVEKLEDIVGLYLDPPEHALVLCCDEKSQVQALDRTQPGLPLKKGRAATMTHDYKRHGTRTLVAALNTLDGAVIASCMKRHRHIEWLRFLRQIDRETPKDKEPHLICDNYATHNHPKVGRGLERHPRFHAHFTPTSSSWLNMVERFFRDLSTKRLRRDGKQRAQWVRLRKGVAYLFRYREVSLQANARYLDALAALDDPTKGKQALAASDHHEEGCRGPLLPGVQSDGATRRRSVGEPDGRRALLARIHQPRHRLTADEDTVAALVC